MKIYIDVVLFLNFFFDFLLLLGVSLMLKRRGKLYKILLGALIGSLSTFLLFTTISSFKLFLFKMIISILMCITAFDYKNIKYTLKNIIYLYIISIFLGGFLYIINNQLAYKQNGLIFFHNGLSINVILIIILTPLIIYFYIKQSKNLKNNYNNYYLLDIYINNKIIHTTSYLDTGNKLVDPYTFKPVILLCNKDPVFNNLKYILIPYHTISDTGFIKGYKVDKIYIEGVGYKKNVIVALVDKLNIDGVESILNTKILEEI